MIGQSIATFSIATFAGVNTTDAPNIPGLEYTLSTNRLHYILDEQLLHYTLPINRLHYSVEDNE